MKVRKIIFDWREVIVFGVLIIALALTLRLWNLTSLPVFADEAIYVRWAQVMRSEATLRFLPLSDGKQPLFMWSIIPFLKFFNNPLVAGRFVSVMTGMGSLVGVFVLSYLLFKSRRSALFASLVYAIAPFTVFFDRMALVDSMLASFGLWVLIFAIVTARTLRLDMAMLTGFALGGALLTKSPALFFVLLIPTTILFVAWPKTKSRQVFVALRLFGLWIVSWVIGYGMFNILRLGPNFHLINSRNNDYIFPISHIIENPKDPFLPHFDRAIEWITMLGPSIIIILLFAGVVLNVHKYRREVFILLTWAFVPIAAQAEFAKVFTARYILFSVPVLLILAGVAFVPLAYLLKENFGRLGKYSLYIVGMLGIVFAAQALWLDYLMITRPEAAGLPRSERSGYLEEWTAGTGIYEVSEFLKQERLANSEQQIIVGTEGFFGTLPDGLQIYLEGAQGITAIGIGLNIDKVPEPLANAKRAGDRVFLVANSSRLKFDGGFEEHGLRVVRSYKKADRPHGRELVQHGPFDTLYLLEITDEAM